MRDECPWCNGTGTILKDGTLLRCRECNGTGFIEEPQTKPLSWEDEPNNDPEF